MILPNREFMPKTEITCTVSFRFRFIENVYTSSLISRIHKNWMKKFKEGNWSNFRLKFLALYVYQLFRHPYEFLLNLNRVFCFVISFMEIGSVSLWKWNWVLLVFSCWIFHECFSQITFQWNLIHILGGSLCT